MVTKLKPGAILVRKHQYPLPLEAQVCILPHINRLKQTGILIECQSSWNTPILPVKKEGGQDYRPVQDLRLANQETVTLHSSLVNQATMTLHPTVPNPYTLLSLLSLSAKIYTCLYLKNAFFCICLIPVSQPIFAFEWDNPAGGSKQQLPGLTSHKDLRIPPTIFGEALASNLDSFRPEQFSCWLLQYVDDLLLAAKNGENCWKGTKAFLQLLLESGYQV